MQRHAQPGRRSDRCRRRRARHARRRHDRDPLRATIWSSSPAPTSPWASGCDGVAARRVTLPRRRQLPLRDGVGRCRRGRHPRSRATGRASSRPTQRRRRRRSPDRRRGAGRVLHRHDRHRLPRGPRRRRRADQREQDHRRVGRTVIARSRRSTTAAAISLDGGAGNDQLVADYVCGGHTLHRRHRPRHRRLRAQRQVGRSARSSAGPATLPQRLVGLRREHGPVSDTSADWTHVQNTGAGADLEVLEASDGPDHLWGDDRANVMWGRGGGDHVYGLGGDDEMLGADGRNVVIDGGGGDNHITQGKASYSSSPRRLRRRAGAASSAGRTATGRAGAPRRSGCPSRAPSRRAMYACSVASSAGLSRRSSPTAGFAGSGRARRGATASGKIADVDHVAAHRDAARERVLELAHVAGPAMLPERAQRGAGEPRRRLGRGRAARASCSTSSGTSPSRSRSGGTAIVITSRRNREILAEPAGGGELGERALARGDDADVDLARLACRRRGGSCRPAARAAASPASPALVSAISSRNSVPPSATSNRPRRSRSAPVNAPRTWPNSSLSSSGSGTALQLIATNAPSVRGP